MEDTTAHDFAPPAAGQRCVQRGPSLRALLQSAGQLRHPAVQPERMSVPSTNINVRHLGG